MFSLSSISLSISPYLVSADFFQIKLQSSISLSAIINKANNFEGMLYSNLSSIILPRTSFSDTSVTSHYCKRNTGPWTQSTMKDPRSWSNILGLSFKTVLSNQIVQPHSCHRTYAYQQLVMPPLHYPSAFRKCGAKFVFKWNKGVRQYKELV